MFTKFFNAPSTPVEIGSAGTSAEQEDEGVTQFVVTQLV
jgi:hypothetical protein